MMASGSRRSRWLVLLGVVSTSGLVAHCSAGDEAAGGPYGGGGALADVNRDTAESSPDVPVAPDSGEGPPYHEACGVVSSGCVPDQPLSCAAFSTGGAGSSSSAAAGGGGTGGAPADGSGGASAEGGAGGAAPTAAGGGGQGGAPPQTAGGASDGPEAGAGGQAGAAGSGGAAPTPEYSCQVVLRMDSGPLAECLPAGAADVDEPCFTTGDCAPGLACVVTGPGSPPVATCRPFCCAGDSSCTQGSYCVERPLANDAGTTLEVPVCMPAQNCSLSEPYPCEGGPCSCAEGTACMVVRADGTTTCVEPGQGQAGDACPCAWGHVCSASNQCVLLCETARAEHFCGNAKCQASAELPEGWGVCVGPDPDAAAR